MICVVYVLSDICATFQPSAVECEKNLLSESCIGKKCADCRDRGDSYLLSEADVMSVADYGPSSQTLTFLDPEDDLGSLGIGADTQVRCPTAATQPELCCLDAT